MSYSGKCALRSGRSDRAASCSILFRVTPTLTMDASETNHPVTFPVVVRLRGSESICHLGSLGGI